MVTLREVAEAAGVHLTTVSSVLNGASGHSRFSEETRRKVEQAATRLGYARNHLAGSLRTRRTGTVGLVAGNIQNPFFAALSLQLEAHLRDAGYALVLTCHGADSAGDERELAQTLLGRSVDGLLIWSEQRDGRTLRLPARTTTPRVWMGHGPRGEPAATIDIAEGLDLAVRHVRALGGRRIGFYAPAYAERSGLPRSRPDLLDTACAAAGLPPAVRLFFPGESWNLDTAVRGAAPLLESARAAGVDAIVAYNDVCASGWHLAARARGGALPVIGFDGSPLIKAWRPALAHVDLQGDTLARSAVGLLATLLGGGTPARRRIEVRPTFVAAAD
jgi:LacI family transcriptional regulator